MQAWSYRTISLAVSRVGGGWIGAQQMHSVHPSEQDVMLRDLQKTPCGRVQLMNKYTLLYVLT